MKMTWNDITDALTTSAETLENLRGDAYAYHTQASMFTDRRTTGAKKEKEEAQILRQIGVMEWNEQEGLKMAMEAISANDQTFGDEDLSYTLISLLIPRVEHALHLAGMENPGGIVENPEEEITRLLTDAWGETGITEFLASRHPKEIAA